MRLARGSTVSSSAAMVMSSLFWSILACRNGDRLPLKRMRRASGYLLEPRFTNSGSIRDDRCCRPPKLGDDNSAPDKDTDNSARGNNTDSNDRCSGSDSNAHGNNRLMPVLVLNRRHKEGPQGSARTRIS